MRVRYSLLNSHPGFDPLFLQLLQYCLQYSICNSCVIGCRSIEFLSCNYTISLPALTLMTRPTRPHPIQKLVQTIQKNFGDDTPSCTWVLCLPTRVLKLQLLGAYFVRGMFTDHTCQPSAHEKLIVNVKGEPTGHCRRRDRTNPSTPWSTEHRLRSEAGENSESEFRRNLNVN